MIGWLRRKKSDTTPADFWNQRFSELTAQAKNPLLKAFYAAGLAQGTTPIEQVSLVAMDFETTGLDANSDEIISIGIVPFNLHRIFCRDASHWILKPRLQFDGESVLFHGITHSDVIRAPDLQSIIEELLQALRGQVVVVHFRHIEQPFLARALRQRLGEAIEFPVIDTMQLEKQILLRRRHLLDRLFDRPLPSLQLAGCRARYGLPYYQPHHALTDALATAELLQAQLQHHYDQKTPVSKLWC